MPNSKNSCSGDDVARVFASGSGLTKLLQAGVYRAVLKHKQAGVPICGMENGKLVWIAPEDIKVPKEYWPKGSENNK